MRVFDSTADLDAAIDTIQAAALDVRKWPEAMQAVAVVTGLVGEQLFGSTGDLDHDFEWLTDVEPKGLNTSGPVGGNGVKVYDRPHTGLADNPIGIPGEQPVATEADLAVSRACDHRVLLTDSGRTSLIEQAEPPDFNARFTIVTATNEGAMSAERARNYTVLTRHLRHALKVQRMFSEQAQRLVTQTLDRMEAIGFVCQSGGRVTAMTRSAEDFLRQDHRLKLRDGMLTLAGGAATSLKEAISEALVCGVSIPIVVRDNCGRRPLVLEVAQMTLDNRATALNESVMIIVRDPDRADRKSVSKARAVFGYTATETRVAAALMAGRAPTIIAHEMGVELATVRTHIRRIYEKSDVCSQLELTSLLGAMR